MTGRAADDRPSRAVVRDVLTNGRRVSTALGRFVFGRPERGEGRIFFVVAKSVAKRSTVRNRIRRQLREWARRSGLGTRLGRDVVVLVALDTAALSRRVLRERMANAFIQLGGAPGDQ